jgi:DNA-binding NarL/FixJ family response regulator
MLSPAITSRLIGRFTRQLEVDTDATRRLEQLSDRERDVLLEIAHGLSNGEIAERLFISAATVKSHITHVFTKLGVRDRAQAVAFAYESGLVTPGEADGRP